MNVVLCDGGLANRLNALVFALILKQRYGHDWRISWPVNNWCGAALESLFVPPLPHDALPLSHYRHHDARTMLMQENQLDFPAERIVLHQGLHGWSDYLKAIVVMEDWDRELGAAPTAMTVWRQPAGARSDVMP